MDAPSIALLAGLICVAAVLYTSVGHAGASGYIAAMALVGVSPWLMKPTALALNIVVAAFATLRWTRNGRDLAWSTLLPLILGSVPAAFVGGAFQLSDRLYKTLVGIVLLVAGLRLLSQSRSDAAPNDRVSPLPWLAGIAIGAAVGFVSGLTGTGGGIFLTPLLLWSGRADPRQVAGLTIPFILLNSIAGLLGNVAALHRLPAELPWFILAALLGALVGTQMGIRWVSTQTLQRLMGVVLLVAAAKFLLG